MTTSARRSSGKSLQHIVPSILSRGVPQEEDKKELQASFSRSETYREIAIAHLKKEKRKLEQFVGQGDYNVASWSHYQADRNGAIRTINQMLRDLFNIDTATGD